MAAQLAAMPRVSIDHRSCID